MKAFNTLERFFETAEEVAKYVNNFQEREHAELFLDVCSFYNISKAYAEHPFLKFIIMISTLEKVSNPEHKTFKDWLVAGGNKELVEKELDKLESPEYGPFKEMINDIFEEKYIEEFGALRNLRQFLWKNLEEEKKIQLVKSFSQQEVSTFIACVQTSAYEIVYNLLLGNLPGAYFSMRKLLESSIDITIAALRFPEKKFPDCIEGVKELNFSFDEKRDKLLPSWCGDETKKKAKQLWHFTSSWAHAGGITREFAEKIEEQKASKPFPYPGSIVLPHQYDEDDLPELKESGGYLENLREVMKRVFGIER